MSAYRARLRAPFVPFIVVVNVTVVLTTGDVAGTTARIQFPLATLLAQLQAGGTNIALPSSGTAAVTTSVFQVSGKVDPTAYDFSIAGVRMVQSANAALTALIVSGQDTGVGCDNNLTGIAFAEVFTVTLNNQARPKLQALANPAQPLQLPITDDIEIDYTITTNLAANETEQFFLAVWVTPRKDLK